jgi:3-oxoacyl-[acyl-carrier protein] reductase
MNLGIDGKVALVTGASAGIGKAIAAALATEGAQVAITSRTRGRIDAAATDLGATGFVHDSSDLDAVPQLIADVQDALGPIEILVTNTGGPPSGVDPFAFTDEQWQTAHSNLVLAPIRLIEQVAPGMRERGFGRILNIASSSSREPLDLLILSTAHRPGTIGAFKTLARQMAADGVTLNTILPGWIATARLAETAGSIEAAQAGAATQVPIGRLGTPEELAAVAAFLCSAPGQRATSPAPPCSSTAASPEGSGDTPRRKAVARPQ